MEILIILFLILINGVFSMSEIALVSSRKFKLESEVKKGNANAKKALELANNPNTFLSTVQIGITLIGLLTGIYSGEKITTDLQSAVTSVPFLAHYAQPLSVLIVLIVITYFSLVFGELLPKRIGLAFPETIATFVARPMSILSRLTKPFIWLLTKSNDLILKLFGFKEKEEIVSEEEIKSMVQESAESGEIEEIEHGIVQRVFALGDRKVSELMTPRSGLIWLDTNDNLETVKQKITAEIHSVYPVANGHLDELAGIVFTKDLFTGNPDRQNFQIESFVKKPLIVHDLMPVYNVLEQFKTSKQQAALIVDEYGIIQGMISMSDIVDALIGSASQPDQEDYKIIPKDENSWLADGQYPFFAFLDFFGLPPEEDGQGNYNTLAGLLISYLQHIPEEGETLAWRDFRFTIVDMDGQRIDKILIERK